MKIPSDDLAFDQLHSSYLILATLGGLVLLTGLLYVAGIVGRVVALISAALRGLTRLGLRVWSALLWWMPWPVALVAAAGVLVGGHEEVEAGYGWVGVLAGVAAVFFGATTCLAYMSLAHERYEVARGIKVLHDPADGQALAENLIAHGSRLSVPLMAIATAATVCGFALLNLGLYRSVGREWYAGSRDAAAVLNYLDFLVNAIINILRIVDFLDLARKSYEVDMSYVKQVALPAKLMMTAFRMFFTLVLLQQLFDSLRQKRMVTEAVGDYWSPYEPVRERARQSLGRFGPGVIRPMLTAIGRSESLPRERRDELADVLCRMGPVAAPALRKCLQSRHAGTRAVAVSALGRLGDVRALRKATWLLKDANEYVRTEAAAAVGRVAAAAAAEAGRERRSDPVPAVVAALAAALTDESPAVRQQAAAGLAELGEYARPAVPELVTLLQAGGDDERTCAAQALGRIRGSDPSVPGARPRHAGRRPGRAGGGGGGPRHVRGRRVGAGLDRVAPRPGRGRPRGGDGGDQPDRLPRRAGGQGHRRRHGERRRRRTGADGRGARRHGPGGGGGGVRARPRLGRRDRPGADEVGRGARPSGAEGGGGRAGVDQRARGRGRRGRRPRGRGPGGDGAGRPAGRRFPAAKAAARQRRSAGGGGRGVGKLKVAAAGPAFVALCDDAESAVRRAAVAALGGSTLGRPRRGGPSAVGWRTTKPKFVKPPSKPCSRSGRSTSTKPPPRWRGWTTGAKGWSGRCCAGLPRVTTPVAGAGEAVVRQLTHGGSEATRIAAADALGLLCVTDAVAPLADAAGHGTAPVRVASMRALAASAPPRPPTP